ncbi:nonsense-mediated mRNA decay factor SMG5 [Nymphalis io]|uniref:nonsense-mediated mRNA decay factor SMG5 n=1 Tax=Inachis io TaxID=171585 RepID=UPI002169AA4A|nr:nonsense-mediated mRNA decay factor SMG5 [Nymphalis io]
MTNGCNEYLESKTAERNERAKKVYRYVSDIARRLSEATAECRVLPDLFSTDIESQRQKLRDYCEKLFFLDPENYGKKSLELLWRKVYYDTVSVSKKLRASDNGGDNYLFSHILCGIGQFHHFMTKVQSEMHIELKELDFLPLLVDEENEEVVQESQQPEQYYELGKSILFSCLIYLGDLSRYQVEIFNTFDSSLAARYYLQAAQIDLTSGMPFNQLGNLYLDKNYNLDSVCYYIHCLNALVPFEGAIGNLTKIFEKNSQFCDSMNMTDSMTQAEHMQITIAKFLTLIEIWYLGKEDNNVPKECNTIALQFKIAMDFTKTPLPDINKNYNEYTQAIEEENVNPSYLNASIIHNIVQICLFTIAKLNDSDESKAFACKAFTLAFLSQILQKLLKKLESFGLKNPAHKYKSRYIPKNISNKEIEKDLDCEKNLETVTEPNEENLTNGDTNCYDEKLSKENNSEEINTLTNGDVKNNKKIVTKRRRRRRVASSESSDMSDIDTESSGVDTDKSDSEEEDASDSPFQSDDDSKSEGSVYDGEDNELDVKINGKLENINTTSIEDGNKESNADIEVTIKNLDTTNLDTTQPLDCTNKVIVSEIEKFLLGDNFLPSIKLLQDWVLTEKDLILSCGDSGEALFQCVVDLLNIFLYYFSTKGNEIITSTEYKILDYAKRIAKRLRLEYKSIPLPEDINLRGTNICKFDKDAAEWQLIDKSKPTVIEENIIRILNFIDFGYQIAKIIPRIRYNRSLKIFYFKKSLPPKMTTKINHKKVREWQNSKKQTETSESGLLRRLGRLWLASQVRELERSGQTDVPSLLAVDTATLYKHLRRIKQLLRTRNFIFLVPTIVLQELDELKRERSSARDAIRWLEIQLKSGSRFLRTQRPGQSRPLPLLKYPRKAPPHVHNFIQILEFCNHFTADEKQNQGGNGDPDNSVHGKSAPLLILLVGNEPGKSDEHYKEFSLTGAAQASGITVQYIGDFYTKWRQTMHKSGKKR